VAVLLDDLVSEEGDGHDAAHLAPVLAVDGEDHVLALAGEDVENDVAGAGAELHALRVQHLFGEVRRGNHDQVALPHAEEEDVAEALCESGEVAVVEVIADLEPVAKDGDGEWARRELEAFAAELGDGNGYHRREEEAEEGLLQEEEIHYWWRGGVELSKINKVWIGLFSDLLILRGL